MSVALPTDSIPSDRAGRTKEKDRIAAAKAANGRTGPSVVAEVLALVVDAVWADVTGDKQRYGPVPWGTEP